MGKDIMIEALIGHLMEKYNAKCSMVWYYNVVHEPLFYIKVPKLRTLIIFKTNDLLLIYDEAGYEYMCDIVDMNIDNFIDMYGDY